jgi:hypothetical protein
MISQLGSMARTLLTAGQQKPKTKTKKKRAAEDTLGDEYTEKRAKTNCLGAVGDGERGNRCNPGKRTRPVDLVPEINGRIRQAPQGCRR